MKSRRLVSRLQSMMALRIGSNRMHGYNVAARSLADLGLEVVFGLVGDGNLFLIDSLIREFGVCYISAAHESAVVSMADAYARVSGKTGVAIVTHGPGLTNTVTALTEAARNNTRLLLICGDTPSAEREHLQDIHQREVIQATGAGFEEVRASGSIGADLAVAVRRMRTERRPIVLNFPVDIALATASYAKINRVQETVQLLYPAAQRSTRRWVQSLRQTDQ